VKSRWRPLIKFSSYIYRHISLDRYCRSGSHCVPACAFYLVRPRKLEVVDAQPQYRMIPEDGKNYRAGTLLCVPADRSCRRFWCVSLR